MPFTPAHAAAALPFRRTRLVPSALLIGTFAPDLEYFVRLAAGGGWGHTVAGVFGLSLPGGLAALWVFHRLVKVPLVYLLPDSIRARLTPELAPFGFLPALRFVNVLLSLLIGIATHLLWDGFTHANYWPGRDITTLHHGFSLAGGWFTLFDVLQLISSVGGLLALAIWSLHWYRRTPPDPCMPPNPFTPRHRHVIVAMGITVAIAGASLRSWIGVGAPTTISLLSDFIGQYIVTFGALAWWQLAMWGLLGPFRHTHRHASEEEAYLQSRTSVRP